MVGGRWEELKVGKGSRGRNRGLMGVWGTGIMVGERVGARLGSAPVAAAARLF